MNNEQKLKELEFMINNFLVIIGSYHWAKRNGKKTFSFNRTINNKVSLHTFRLNKISYFKELFEKELEPYLDKNTHSGTKTTEIIS